MKRLVCATLIPSVLALTLMGTVAASAQSYGRGGYDRGYSHSDRRGGHDNTGALIGLGIGLFALGAIVAASSHNNDRDRYDDRYQNSYAPAYQGGYYQNRGGYQNGYRGNYQSYRGNGYDYGNGYGNGYGNR